jgi:SAM-dependent methyltransferase
MQKEPAGSKVGSSRVFWDTSANDYDRLREGDHVYAACIQEVVRRSGRRSAALCLDAGCGTGQATLRCARRARDTVAVDYSFQQLLMLKSKGLPHVMLVQADVRKLPFKSGVFDRTVCANTLQHLKPEWQPEAIQELQRVTLPEGRVAISVHHFSRQKQAAGWKKEGRPGAGDTDYIFRFSRRELRALLPRASISSAGFYGVARVPLVGRALQRAMTRVFGKLAAWLGFGHMLIGVSRRRPRLRPARAVH